jgi:hypothetical protein
MHTHITHLKRDGLRLPPLLLLPPAAAFAAAAAAAAVWGSR